MVIKQISKMKWTPDTTYRFVKEYVRHECLYSSKYPKRNAQRARLVALQKISEAMNIPGFRSREVYMKVRSLRSTYAQEKKKIQQSVQSGCEDVYVPKMRWFKLLHKALTNEQGGDLQINFKSDSEHAVTDEEGPSSSQLNQLHHAETQNKIYCGKIEENLRKPQFIHKRKVPNRNNAVKIELLRRAAKHKRSIQNLQTESEFDIFGQSIAAQLKNMPLKLALEGQMYVQNYLSNLRLQQMSDGHVHNSSPNSVYLSSSPSHMNSPSPPNPFTESAIFIPSTNKIKAESRHINNGNRSPISVHQSLSPSHTNSSSPSDSCTESAIFSPSTQKMEPES